MYTSRRCPKWPLLLEPLGFVEKERYDVTQQLNELCMQHIFVNSIVLSFGTIYYNVQGGESVDEFL